MAGGRIRLFRWSQKLQRWMGVFVTKSNEVAPFNCRNAIFLVCFVHFFVPPFLFFMFKSHTFKEYSGSFYEFASATSTSSYYVVQMVQIANFHKLAKKFEDYLEQNGSSTRHQYYIKLNKNVELFTKLIHWSTYASVINITFPQLFLSFMNYYVFDLGTESFYLPFPNVLPFDWKTPFGCFIAVLAQAIALYCVVFNIAPVLGFMLGSCLFSIAFIEDIGSEFEDLATSEMTSENQLEMKKRFGHVIHLYSKVKELIGDFNQIYKYIVFIFIAWCLVTTSCDFLLLQTEILSIFDPDAKLIDIITAFQLISMMFWSFFLVTFYCWVGEMLTNQFNRFDEHLCQSNWYLFPMDMQRLYLMFIGNTQRPALICGYGNILCTRDTLKKTINTGFSYFMLIRQMQ